MNLLFSTIRNIFDKLLARVVDWLKPSSAAAAALEAALILISSISGASSGSAPSAPFYHDVENYFCSGLLSSSVAAFATRLSPGWNLIMIADTRIPQCIESSLTTLSLSTLCQCSFAAHGISRQKSR